MGLSRPKFMISNSKGAEPQKILYKTTCPRSQGKERKVSAILSGKGHRPFVHGVGEEYHIEEFIANSGMLPANLVENDEMLQQVAKSIAVLHHDEDIKAYLRTKDPNTNKIMSDSCEDWYKLFNEQDTWAVYQSKIENP